ncbi:hypothetical protein HOB83_03765 [Candidatus Woesearchaeota archaeon]|nr:hypothetical protein [Candidatus Woesearchaeota archaeon]MBT4712684.1 hypothetical protein [Candidatus Woesearchaeota archaeon]
MNLFKKKCYVCSKCGYKSVQAIKTCPTCGTSLEEYCCKCGCAKGNCTCKKC